MGWLTLVVESLYKQTANQSIIAIIASGFAAFIVVAVLLNVLWQLLLKNSKEPPVVFHWVPFIGSTISYGIDPYKFFFRCQEKVELLSADFCLCERGLIVDRQSVWRCVHLYFARKEDHRVLRAQRQRFHSQRETEGCQRGGNLQSVNDPGVWPRGGVRLSQCKTDGAEEGGAYLCQSRFHG